MQEVFIEKIAGTKKPLRNSERFYCDHTIAINTYCLDL